MEMTSQKPNKLQTKSTWTTATTGMFLLQCMHFWHHLKNLHSGIEVLFLGGGEGAGINLQLQIPVFCTYGMFEEFSK
jgi:hypothetical protein